MTKRFLALLPIPIAAVTLIGCAADDDERAARDTTEPVITPTASGTPQMQQGWLPAATGQPTGEQFVREAAMGNMAEVELSQLALERATDESVRAFAQRMVQDHTMLHNDLAQVARSQNIGLPLGMDVTHQQTAQRLTDLQGSEFDAAYMRHMLDDHNRSIALHERQARDAGNPAIQSVAQAALPVLRDHLREAQQIASRMPGGAPTGPAAATPSEPLTRPVNLPESPSPTPTDRPEFVSPRPAPPPESPR